MKKLVYVFILLLWFSSCKKESVDKGQTGKRDAERQEELSSKEESQASQSQWQTVKESGFYYTNFAGPGGGEEYDASFQPIRHSEIAYQLTPVSIMAITKTKQAKDDLEKDDHCYWANFVKISHRGKEKIVFGKHVYLPVNKHEAKNFSVWETKNHTTGVADEDGSTGCNEYHPLLLIDRSEKAYTIQEDDEEADEPLYVSLVESDSESEKIQSITEENGTLTLHVTRMFQEGVEEYTIKIFQREDTWWANLSEPKEAVDERLLAENSMDEMEGEALDKHLKAWTKDGRKADVKLIGKYIDYIKYIINNHPESMTHPFRELVGNRAMETVTSEDNKLRFYSFNRELGGSMQFYDALCQTNENGTVKTIDILENEGDNGYYVSDIYTFDTEKETYYVVIANQIASNRDIVQIARAYTLNNGNLRPAKLFTTTKKDYDEIPVYYNFFSAMDAHDERPIRVIRYDDDTKELLVAMVDEDGNVSDKNLIYKWTGNEFQYKGVK